MKYLYLTWNACITLSTIKIVYRHILEFDFSFLDRNFFLFLGLLDILLLLVIVLCLTLSFNRSHLSLDCATLKTFPPTHQINASGRPGRLLDSLDFLLPEPRSEAGPALTICVTNPTRCHHLPN